MKNLTNFHETVETDVDPRLLFTIFFPSTQLTITVSAYQRIVTYFGLIKGSYSQKFWRFDTSLFVCVCFFFLLLQIDSQHYVRSKMDQLGLSWDTDKK